ISVWGEIERDRIKPCRPSMRQVSAHATGPAACGSEIASPDKYVRVRKVREAAVVIGVQMREDDACDISRSDAEGAQLGTDILFALDAKAHLPSVIRMQRSPGLEQVHSLAGLASPAFRLRSLDPDRAGLDGVNL